MGPVVVEVAAGSEGAELRDGGGAAGGGLPHVYPVMVGTRGGGGRADRQVREVSDLERYQPGAPMS
jgi:hypothetical protein